MSRLLESSPFSARDEAAFLAEMNELCEWHLSGCAEYRRVWPDWSAAKQTDEFPYLHVGVFKRRVWITVGPGVVHQRTLRSSSTSAASASQITLDERSSTLQARSSSGILRDWLGDEARPVAILDDAHSLRKRGEISARVTAAMSLRPWASEMCFVLREAEKPESVCWEDLGELAARHRRLLVYGFTWMLWRGWGCADIPAEVRRHLACTEVQFVHSGGWKKLEAARVDRQQFDAALLATVGPGSKVTDYYGLVEQVGLVFPLCETGYRHVPRWAAVAVRDPWTLEPLEDRPGLLQFMNVLSWGAPYHSVLTEDVGQILPGPCPCGRSGPRFELLGRVPKAELRGCANV